MISDLLFRFRALFRRKLMEADLDEELRAHFERQVEKYVQSGLPVAEARRRARLEFGGLDQVKEECRDARGVNFVEITIRDLRAGRRRSIPWWRCGTNDWRFSIERWRLNAAASADPTFGSAVGPGTSR